MGCGSSIDASKTYQQRQQINPAFVNQAIVRKSSDQPDNTVKSTPSKEILHTRGSLSENMNDAETPSHANSTGCFHSASFANDV